MIIAERQSWMGRSRAVCFVVAAFLMVGPAGAFAEPPEVVRGNLRLVNAVVASIDGKAITLREFKLYESGRGRLLPVDQRRTDAEFLDGMIEERLLESEFERRQIHADDEDTQYYIDRVMQMNHSTRADVERALAEIGLKWADYFERMRFEVEKLTLINREIRSRVQVTDEEVARYWKTSGAGTEGAGMEVSHIFIPMPSLGRDDELEEARQRAAEAHHMVETDGFARAAKTYSQGPTAADGGKLGTFEKGTMAPAFEQQLAGLTEGQYTEPFEEGGGIHILRLDRVIVAGNEKELTDDRREEIRDKLYDDMLDERLQRWVQEDLHKKYHVTTRLSHVATLLDRPASAATGT